MWLFGLLWVWVWRWGGFIHFYEYSNHSSFKLLQVVQDVFNLNGIKIINYGKQIYQTQQRKLVLSE